MPVPPRPDPPTRVCKLVFSGSYGLKPWNNVMWLFLTGSGVITNSDLNDLADQIKAVYVAHLCPLLNTGSVLTNTQVVLYADGGPFEGNAEGSDAGTRAGDGLPASIALALSWKISAHYRGGHPRTYLCGIRVLDLASVSTFASSYLTAASAGADAFHTGLEDITPGTGSITAVEHGVVSFVDSGEWRTPPIFRRIVSSSVDSRIDTQRRRLGRDIP